MRCANDARFQVDEYNHFSGASLADNEETGVEMTGLSPAPTQYDLRSKGVNNHATKEGELLKEMVFRILN